MLGVWLRSYVCAPPLGCPVSHPKAPQTVQNKNTEAGGKLDW